MKYACILMLVALPSCSHKTITSRLTENTKQEIEIIKSQVKTLTCDKVEKTEIMQRLESVKKSVENIDLACKTEKQILTERINKLHAILLSVAVILIVFLYLNYKIKGKF